MASRQPSIYLTALHLRHGGVERALTNQANLLAQMGYSVTLLVVYPLGQPAYALDPRVKVVYLTQDRPNRAAFWSAVEAHRYGRALKEGFKALGILWRKRRALIRAIRSVETGVLISSRHEHSCLLARYRQPQVQAIAYLHHDWQPHPQVARDLVKVYSRLDDFCLLLPQLTAEVKGLFEAAGCGPDQYPRLWTTGNFLSQAQVEQARAQAPLRERPPVLVWAGRLEPEKDPLAAVEAFAQALQTAQLDESAVCAHAFANRLNASPGPPVASDWRLRILGGGSLEPKLRQLIDDLGLNDFIQLEGMVSHEQVLEALKTARGLLLTSRSEGFGFVFLEALAAQAALLAYDVRVAPQHFVRTGQTGFLIPPGAVEQMAQAIQTVLGTHPPDLDPDAQVALLEETGEAVTRSQLAAMVQLGPRHQQPDCQRRSKA